jgi:hypothetical protein
VRTVLQRGFGSGILFGAAMPRWDVWRMVCRRASGAGNSNPDRLLHLPRQGTTDYLTNGGRIEVPQRMAGHSNARTVGLYDRRKDDISVG